MTDSQHAGLRFSRPPTTTKLGKCTEVVKTHIPVEMDERLRRLASDAGCSTSELLRDLIALLTYGKTYGELEAAGRRHLLLGSGTELDLAMARIRASQGDNEESQ